MPYDYRKKEVGISIPVGPCLVKNQKMDAKGIFYVVRDSSNVKFFIPENLMKRNATEVETQEFMAKWNKTQQSK